MPVPKVSPVTLKKVDCNQRLFAWKTLDNNDLNQVVASSGFSENKSAQSRRLIKPGLGHSYLKIFFPVCNLSVLSLSAWSMNLTVQHSTC